jgi:hypothetical protein
MEQFDSLRHRGKQITLILNKEEEYEFKSGNAATPITIRVSFCDLTLKE